MDTKLKVPVWIAIEADVLICKSLNSTEKVLYALISALSNNEQKKCFATNKYFATVLSITEREVQHCIVKLKEMNLIRTEIENNNKRSMTTTVNAFLEYRKEKVDSLRELHCDVLEYDWLNEN